MTDLESVRRLIEALEDPRNFAEEIDSTAQATLPALRSLLSSASRAEIAKDYCIELLSLKGNSFDINTLAEKIHYALS